MKDSTNAQVIFPFAPPPLPGESIASWVIRLCGSHGYGFTTVKKLAQVKVKYDDWDRGMDHQSTLRLLEAAGLEYKEFFNENLDPHFLQECGVVLHPINTDWGPAYGFCPMCFAEDQVPYLRWRWRYKNFKKCTRHQRTLLLSCPHCGARLNSSRPILRDDSSEEYIPNLGYCKNCAQPMFVDIQNTKPKFKHPWELRRDWVRTVNPFDSQSVSMWLVLGRVAPFPWSVNFDSPVEIKPVYKARKTGLKKYSRLSLYGRAKVAKALGLIRAEKHRQRADERISTQVGDPAKS